MQPVSWPAPAGEELAVCSDKGRARRLLVLPALFDEANKLRHFTVEVLRMLDDAGIDSFLPDLPGTNESLAPLQTQTLASWREAANAAAGHFGATHRLAVRGGGLLAPAGGCIHYAPVAGASILRAMLRMQVMAEREVGHEVTREALLEQARDTGIVLAGYHLGAAMIGQLEEASAAPPPDIAQGDLGGGGLWLRVEPAHDADQARKLADLVLERLV